MAVLALLLLIKKYIQDLKLNFHLTVDSNYRLIPLLSDRLTIEHISPISFQHPAVHQQTHQVIKQGWWYYWTMRTRMADGRRLGRQVPNRQAANGHKNSRANDIIHLYIFEILIPILEGCSDNRLDNFLDPLIPDQQQPFDKFTIKHSYTEVVGDLIGGKHEHLRQGRDVDKETYRNNRKGTDIFRGWMGLNFDMKDNWSPSLKYISQPYVIMYTRLVPTRFESSVRRKLGPVSVIEVVTSVALSFKALCINPLECESHNVYKCKHGRVKKLYKLILSQETITFVLTFVISLFSMLKLEKGPAPSYVTS